MIVSNWKFCHITIMFALIGAWTTTHVLAQECDKDGTSVAISASIDSTRRSYSYELANRSSSAIFMLILGASERDEMLVVPENIPVVIAAPKAWQGQKVFLASNYMRVLWSSRTPDAYLKPGDRLDGFAITTPQRSSRPDLFFPDGTLATMLDFGRAPFRVIFENGRCIWTRAELVEKK